VSPSGSHFERKLSTDNIYFDFVKSTGVLKPGTAPVDGLFAGGVGPCFPFLRPLQLTPVPQDPLFAGLGVASQVGRSVDNCPYLKHSVEAGMQPFISTFATDPRSSSFRSALAELLGLNH
jgi:hypothetical protein